MKLESGASSISLQDIERDEEIIAFVTFQSYKNHGSKEYKLL